MQIEHMAMYVNDAGAVRDFFIRYFGAAASGYYRNEKTGFLSCFLRFDGGARLEIMCRPAMRDDEKAPVRTGYNHVAFSVGSRGNVDALTERLRNDGFPVLSGPRTTGDGYYESCVLGPEENLIEITV